MGPECQWVLWTIREEEWHRTRFPRNNTLRPLQRLSECSSFEEMAQMGI